MAPLASTQACHSKTSFAGDVADTPDKHAQGLALSGTTSSYPKMDDVVPKPPSGAAEEGPTIVPQVSHAERISPSVIVNAA